MSRADRRVDPESLSWRKSSYSDMSCVEAAPVGDGRVAVRDSKDPHGGVLVFEDHEWRAFLAGARQGEFDFALELD